jgi:hypothetical protein
MRVPACSASTVVPICTGSRLARDGPDHSARYSARYRAHRGADRPAGNGTRSRTRHGGTPGESSASHSADVVFRLSRLGNPIESRPFGLRDSDMACPAVPGSA